MATPYKRKIRKLQRMKDAGLDHPAMGMLQEYYKNNGLVWEEEVQVPVVVEEKVETPEDKTVSKKGKGTKKGTDE